jgi:hypothetical protein
LTNTYSYFTIKAKVLFIYEISNFETDKLHEKNSGFSIEIDETHLNEIEDVYNSNIEAL